jgi:diguanylate cyclase (GGDEF)-like protein
MSADVRSRFDELKSAGQLPSPSGVALEIMRLSQRENVSLQEITRIAQTDPALAGRLLQLANSVAAGPRRPVISLSEAVQRIGLTAVRQAALSFSLLAANRVGTCAGFDYDGFWAHSLATGIAAQAVGRQLKVAAAEECFTLGLLANIGTLALASIYPDQYAQILTQSAAPPLTERLTLERRQFAIDHAEVSAAMLDDWGFPKLFVSAVLHFGAADHIKLAEGTRPAVISACLALASTIASLCILDDAGRKPLLAQLVRRGATVALNEAELAAMLPPIIESWQEWGRLLKVPTAKVPSLESIEQSRHEVPSELHDPARSAFAMRILVVDDDRSMRQVLLTLLGGAGHHVIEARNGDEALQQVLKEPPQLIVTDWEMPVMDGLQFCKALRAAASGRQIYVIILTGHGTEERLTEAFAAGVNDYMTKPLKPREFEARLRAGQRFIEIQQNSIRDSGELRAIANDLVIANRRLQYLARTDELTDLPNRRYSMERLEQEFSAATRKNSRLAVMIADIDHFKQINDTLGHQSGDAVLRELAKVLRAHARAEDTVGRVGGEEFMLVCPGMDSQGAMIAANRLRAAVEAIAGRIGGHTVQITISIGVALRCPQDTATKDIITRCDHALYRAKSDGRNRVQLAPSA